MNKELLKIIKYYGINPQLKYFQSEIFELNEAIIQYEMAYGDMCYSEEAMKGQRQHIAEEIADVMVMLEQFRIYYGINTGEVGEIMNYKIKRQIERIENEK